MLQHLKLGGCSEAVQVGCSEAAAGSIVAEEVGNTQDGCIEVEDESCMSEVLYALLILLYLDWCIGFSSKGCIVRINTQISPS